MIVFLIVNKKIILGWSLKIISLISIFKELDLITLIFTLMAISM